MKEIFIRRSIRKYKDKKINKEDLEKILRAAMQAPSARNQKPWHFLVCDNKEVMTKVSDELPNVSMAKSADLLIVFMAQKDNLLIPDKFEQDMSACIQNSLLEACHLGIGSCWCGIYPDKVRMSKTINIFNIKDYEPFAIVTFGYPENEEDMKFIERYDESRIHYYK